MTEQLTDQLNEQFAAVNEQITSVTEEIMKNTKSLEAPKEIKSLLLESLDKSKDAYSKITDGAKGASKEYEGILAKAQKSASKIGDKITVNSKKNADALFDNMKALVNAKDLNEAVKLQSDFAKKQLEVISSQGTELASLYKSALEEFSKASAQAAEKMKPSL